MTALLLDIGVSTSARIGGEDFAGFNNPRKWVHTVFESAGTEMGPASYL